MRNLALIVAIFISIVVESAAIGAEKLIVQHRPPEGATDRRHEYFHQLLVLSLEKTRADFGDFEVRAAGIPISQARAFELLKQRRLVDVVWTMTTDEREKQAMPIRIPLLKGLLACRVLLINAADRDRFDAISELTDLRSLVAVQGVGWPDTEILAANDLPLVSAADYDGMFRMLTERRVDYFPRSVMEVGTELETFRGLSLAIAPGVAMQYTAPIYFFVAPGNESLHRRLSVGLERAVADGSFQALFEAQPGYGEARRMLDSVRRVIELHNPLITRREAGKPSCMPAASGLSG